MQACCLLPEMQNYEKVTHDIIYNDQGGVTRVELWASRVQVPVIDGCVWWPDAQGYILHASYDVIPGSDKKITEYDLRQQSFQMQKPNIEYNAPTASEYVTILHGNQKPTSSGLFVRVRANSSDEWPRGIESLSSRQLGDLIIATLAYEKYCRRKYHMSREQKDALMSAWMYKTFTQNLLKDETLSEAVIWELWNEFDRSKLWKFGSDRQDCKQEIEQVLKNREEKRFKKVRKQLEDSCKKKAEQIEQQLLYKAVKQAEKREKEQLPQIQASLVQIPRTQDFLDIEYASNFWSIQDDFDYEQSLLYQNALDQTIEQNFVQYDQTYKLNAQTVGYLYTQGFNPVEYLYLNGTALQHQLHIQTCQILDQAAQVQRCLYSRSNLLGVVLDVADAAHHANKQEQIRIAVQLLKIECGLLNVAHELILHAPEYAVSLASGVVHSAKDFVHMFIHPAQTVQGLGRAVYFVLETVALNSSEMVAQYPELRAQRDQKNQQIKDGIRQLGHALVNSTGLQKVELLARFGADFVVPGKIIHAVGGVLGAVRSQSRIMSTLEGVVSSLGEQFGFEEIAQELPQAACELEAAMTQNIGEKVTAEFIEAEVQAAKHAEIIKHFNKNTYEHYLNQFSERIDDIIHMFRNKPGKLKDTPENRKRILDMVKNKDTCFGQDKNGVISYAQIELDGTQLYAEVYKYKIRNCGFNDIGRHRTWNHKTGFKSASNKGY